MTSNHPTPHPGWDEAWNRAEMREPDDLALPDDYRAPGSLAFIIIDHLRDRNGASSRAPEPDLEAEP